MDGFKWGKMVRKVAEGSSPEEGFLDIAGSPVKCVKKEAGL